MMMMLLGAGVQFKDQIRYFAHKFSMSEEAGLRL